MPDSVKEFPLEKEYKKKHGISQQDVAKLRQWINNQPHLPSEHITDLDLILAYHSCERSAEVSKQVIDLHYTLKTLFVNFFKDRSLDAKVMKALKLTLLCPLGEPTHDGNTIIYCRLVDYDVKNFVFMDVIKSVLMVLDLWQFEEGTWPGFVIIIDLDGVTLGHLARLDIQTIQQFLYFLQEALLVRLKGFHFLNAPSFMDRLMMLLRPFLNKRLLDMLSIHQIGSKTLEKFLPMDALPKEAGGKYKGFEELQSEVIAKLVANKDFLELENKKRVVEAKRPGKPKTITDIFGGIEGSFKKLDID